MGSDSSKSEKKNEYQQHQQQNSKPSNLNNLDRRQTAVNYYENQPQSQANLRATYINNQPQTAPAPPLINPYKWKAEPQPPQPEAPQNQKISNQIQSNPNYEAEQHFLNQLNKLNQVQTAPPVVAPVKSKVAVQKKVPANVAIDKPLNIVVSSRPIQKSSIVHQQNATNFTVSNVGTAKIPMSEIKSDHDVFKAKLKNTNLVELRKSLVNNEYLHDVRFVINAETIYAHKALLITSSFLFHQHFQIRNETIMEINGIERGTFMDILTYCYTDKIKVTMDNVLPILLAAHKLEVRQIVNNCHGQIQAAMNPENVFNILAKATEMKYEAIEKKCFEYLLKNEQKCFSSNSFYNLSVENLNKILNFCKFPSDKSSEIVKNHFDGPRSSNANVQRPPNFAPNVQVKGKNSSPMPLIVHDDSSRSQGAVKKNANYAKPMNNRRDNRDHSTSSNVPGKSAGGNRRGSSNLTRSKSKENLSSKQLRVQEIPDLMSVPVSQFENMFKTTTPPVKLNPIRPFAPPLINFDEDLIGSNNNNIITQDDDCKGKIIVMIMERQRGQSLQTTFSRIDFVCKQPMLINEIRFSEDLSIKKAQVVIRIATYNNRGQDNEIHKRTIDYLAGRRLNYIKFDRTPLKLYGGQKFYVKISFSQNVNLRHVNKDGITPNSYVNFQQDNDSKNYFNCITSLVVSNTLNA